MIDLTPLMGPQDGAGTLVTFRVFSSNGRERWLLEDRYRRPWHLETWPRANVRAHAIYYAARLLGMVRIHLPSKRIVLNVTRGSVYDKFRIKFDKLSVFLGTPGLDRKFVVFARNNKDTWFIKVPISDRSIGLARNESSVLDTLAKDEAFAPLVPRHFWIDDTLAIEDVRQSGASFAPLDNAEIVRVHSLLFSRSRHDVPLKCLKTTWEHPSKQPHPHPETRALIQATRIAANDHIKRLNGEMTVECYLAHGDFTPWNVLRAKDGSARIIDWELYGRRPKFFDPFHYIVSQAILVDQASADAILGKILKFGSSVADRYSILLYFGLYLVVQALMYCDLYERGGDVSPQVHWQLRKWKDLLVLLTSEDKYLNEKT